MTYPQSFFQNQSSQSRLQSHPLHDLEDRLSKQTISQARDTDSFDPPCNDEKLIHSYIHRCLEIISQDELIDTPHTAQYLNHKRRRFCRPNTIKTNYLNILVFYRYLKSIGCERLESITRNDISAFIEYQQDRGLQPKTIDLRIRSLYAFLRYLAERDVVSPDLLKKKFRIKLPDPLPRAIDPEDIRTLLKVLDMPRDRAIILTLLRTGMRIGELMDTRVTDVNLEEKRVEIYEARKTRVGRVVYLSQDACSALNVWLNEHDPQIPYLFYSQLRKKFSYSGARILFVRYITRAGLAHKGYTLHCLRHTFASELLNAGMSLECLQQLLGHSCIEMTRRYARLTDITRRAEYFKAMENIERSGIHGSYRCHS